jgi:dTDP-glucose 4,6-dehydratase
VEKLIPKVCKYLHLGRKIPLHNGGSPIRNWLHAADTASAVIRIIECGVTNEIYNICGGYEQSNMDTVKKILAVKNMNEENIEKYVDFSFNRAGQDVRYALDDSKLRSLGWSPKKIFGVEISEIVNYYKDKFVW